jgi:ADP-ribosylglycohydrolase
MRSPTIGVFFAAEHEGELVEAASASAAVTHAHPLGREGAVLIALATALACDDASSAEIIGRRTPEIPIGATGAMRPTACPGSISC